MKKEVSLLYSRLSAWYFSIHWVHSIRLRCRSLNFSTLCLSRFHLFSYVKGEKRQRNVYYVIMKIGKFCYIYICILCWQYGFLLLHFSSILWNIDKWKCYIHVWLFFFPFVERGNWVFPINMYENRHLHKHTHWIKFNIPAEEYV